MFVGEKEYQALMQYYCQARMSRFVPKDCNLPIVLSCPTPYYSLILDFVTKCVNIPKFPVFSNKILYRHFLNKKDVTVENRYPLFDWSLIWYNFHHSHINIYVKDIVYKHLHDVLAHKTRLHMLNLCENNLCNICNVQENAIHLFYFCQKIKPVFGWLLEYIKFVCNFKPENNLKFIYFDFKIEQMSCRNTCVMLLYAYLTAVWSCRDNLQLSSEEVKEIVKKNIMKIKRDILLTYEDNDINLYFGNYLEKIHL